MVVALPRCLPRTSCCCHAKRPLSPPACGVASGAGRSHGDGRPAPRHPPRRVGTASAATLVDGQPAEHPGAVLDRCGWWLARGKQLGPAALPRRGNFWPAGTAAEVGAARGSPKSRPHHSPLTRGHGCGCRQSHLAQLARREVELGLPGLLRRPLRRSHISGTGPTPRLDLSPRLHEPYPELRSSTSRLVASYTASARSRSTARSRCASVLRFRPTDSGATTRRPPAAWRALDAARGDQPGRIVVS